MPVRPLGCVFLGVRPTKCGTTPKKTQPRGLTGIHIRNAVPHGQSGYPIWTPSQNCITTAVHAVFDEKILSARRFSPRIHDVFTSLPSTHNKLFDRHLSHITHHYLSIWILQLQRQAASISTSTISITSTQTLSPTRVMSPKRCQKTSLTRSQLQNLFLLCHLHDPDKSTQNPLARQR